jgi:glycerol-3-phosphate acyltransferase PlsY
VAALSVPIVLLLLDAGGTATLAFASAMAALVTFAHRGNLARLLAGSEPRLARRRPPGPRT